MRILILHHKTRRNSYADLLFELLLQLLTKQNYLVIKTNDFLEANSIADKNSKVIIIVYFDKKPFPFFSAYQLWFLIKKQQIKWLVQVTDNKIISSRLQQLIISNDVEKLLDNKLSSSLSLAVCSHIAQQKITEKHNFEAEKILVFPAASISLFQPISWSEQQSVKMEYTQGRDYFLVYAAGKTFDSFMFLLKAFSAFKKWQQSSMKLVVSGKLYFTQTKEWIEKINTYRYRDDVVITHEPNDKENRVLLASAYAFLHTPIHDNDIVPLLQAMQCETPCISFATDSISEYAEQAAILIEQNNYEQLAEKMILLYKDETLRSKLIERSKQRVQQYTIENAALHLFSAIPQELH